MRLVLLLMLITGTVVAQRDSLYLHCKYDNPVTKKIETVIIQSTIDHICVTYESGKRECYESESWPSVYNDRTIYSFSTNDAPGYLLLKPKKVNKVVEKITLYKPDDTQVEFYDPRTYSGIQILQRLFADPE